MAWIFLVVLYGLVKGARDVFKKKAIRKSSVIEVLFIYTLLSFLLVLPDAGNAGGMSLAQLGWVLLKSSIIFCAWLCGFHAIDQMPVSLYGVVDLSRVLFSTTFGVLLLGESMSLWQGVGLTMVLSGLLMLRAPWRHGVREPVTLKAMLLALGSCLFNAISGTMDKVLMKGMSSSQLQFWYMLFLTLLYAVYLLVTRTPIHWKRALGNGWIWLMSLLFVIGDRALFIANGMEASRVTLMTLFKQASVLVTILGGWLVFKEKNIGYKLICASIVVAGMVVAVL